MNPYQDNLQHIHPQELLQLMKQQELKILDVREPYEVIELPFEGGINIPIYTLLQNFTDLLNKDDVYYILCHHGQRSYYVTDILHQKGYKVINIFGGVDLVNYFR